MTSFLCSCTATHDPWRETHRSMLATTAAMEGFDTFPAPGWLTSAPNTIVGAFVVVYTTNDRKSGTDFFVDKLLEYSYIYIYIYINI